MTVFSDDGDNAGLKLESGWLGEGFEALEGEAL